MEAISKYIFDAWCRVLFVETVADGDNFFDSGGDSLSAVEMMEGVESVYNIEFPLEILFSSGRFDDLVSECVRRLEAESTTIENS